MNPDRSSFHIRAINRAICQEVSIFAIGQGIHHLAESGGELTLYELQTVTLGERQVLQMVLLIIPLTLTKTGTSDLLRLPIISNHCAVKSQLISWVVYDESENNNATTLKLQAELLGDEKTTSQTSWNVMVLALIIMAAQIFYGLRIPTDLITMRR